MKAKDLRSAPLLHRKGLSGKLRSRVLCTNTMGPFRTTWRCWSRWATWFCFRQHSLWLDCAPWLTICWRFDLMRSNSHMYIRGLSGREWPTLAPGRMPSECSDLQL
uniref:(northern house mosquito) hypothetical protein n=1 Tax=Culex pipiens TaxID=7175 RepID=A0A8D8A2Y8_CULPI